MKTILGYNNAVEQLSFSLFPFGAFFLALLGYFVVRVRFKNNFETPLYRQSTLVYEIKPYLFVLSSIKFWSFFAFFGPIGATIGVGGSTSKTFLAPTYID